MAYKVIILYRLYMPPYFLGTFTEYPYINFFMVKYFSILKDIYIGIFISILSLSFFSCSSEIQDNYQNKDDGYLDIAFSKVETRADLASDGSGSFTEGDKVGLYLQGDKGLSYRELTYSGGQWMPTSEAQ